MNLKKPLLTGLLLLACIFSYAQNKEVAVKVFKYGKINPTEFETKVTGVDSAAAAVALFDVGSGWFEINPTTLSMMYVFERHTRYKIINKNGYDLANLNIPVYNGNGYKTDLDYMDAATYNMENGKMVISKINKDAKFTEKQDKNSSLKKFTLPNVKEGSIIEYKYRIKSDFTFTLRPWYFQKEVPVLYSQYTVRVPEYYKYKVTSGGFIYLNPRQEDVNERFTIGTNMIDASSKNMRYIAENVPALKQENFITTMNDYISKVEFELSSTNYPGQGYKEYTTTWPGIIKGLKEDENFGLFADKRSYNKTLLKNIIKTETNPDSVLNLVFTYVKNNIKWDDDYSKYTSLTTPKAVFERKSGNSADINMSLYSLLKEANITVYPVLLSTRANGIHPGLPMVTKFDDVIVMAKIGEKLVLLDAIDKNHTPGLLSFQSMNHEGFKLDMETGTGEWVSLENENVSKKSISYNLKLDTENKFSGTVSIVSSHYEGLIVRDKYQSATNEAEFLKNYKKDKPGLDIKNYKIANLDQNDKLLIESMDVTIEDNTEEAGNLVYFTPLLFERTKENPFKLEERQFPVDFAYPSEENYRLTVDFPETYSLEKGPKNEKVVLPGDMAIFTFMFAAEEGRLQLSSKITFKKSWYTPEEYQGLKELFKNIVRKQAEQIVLKKV